MMAYRMKPIKGLEFMELQCNNCGEKESHHVKLGDIVMQDTITSYFMDKHLCMPKCTHGINVLQKCWKCRLRSFF